MVHISKLEMCTIANFWPMMRGTLFCLSWADLPYYKALREISAVISEVVWNGREEDYLKKKFTSRMHVFIENTRNLLASIILPIP